MTKAQVRRARKSAVVRLISFSGEVRTKGEFNPGRSFFDDQ